MLLVHLCVCVCFKIVSPSRVSHLYLQKYSLTLIIEISRFLMSRLHVCFINVFLHFALRTNSLLCFFHDRVFERCLQQNGNLSWWSLFISLSMVRQKIVPVRHITVLIDHRHYNKLPLSDSNGFRNFLSGILYWSLLLLSTMFNGRWFSYEFECWNEDF